MSSKFDSLVFLSWIRDTQKGKDCGLQDQLRALFADPPPPAPAQQLLVQAARITASEVIRRFCNEHRPLAIQHFNAVQIDSFVSALLQACDTRDGRNQLNLPPTTSSLPRTSQEQEPEQHQQVLDEQWIARRTVVEKEDEAAGRKEIERLVGIRYREITAALRQSYNEASYLVSELKKGRSKKDILAELEQMEMMRKEKERLMEMLEKKKKDELEKKKKDELEKRAEAEARERQWREENEKRKRDREEEQKNRLDALVDRNIKRMEHELGRSLNEKERAAIRIEVEREALISEACQEAGARMGAVESRREHQRLQIRQAFHAGRSAGATVGPPQELGFSVEEVDEFASPDMMF